MPDIELLPPPVTWAQRKSVIFLTFCVEDCKTPEVKIDSDKIYFKGIGGTEKRNYENTLELFKEIDTERSNYFIRDRVIEVILMKKDEGPFWPHLLKEKVKMHWLKVDFAKWKDENDSDEEPEEADFSSMMRQMGGLGGANAGGAGPNLDDMALDGEGDEDSDDDEIPDLE